MSNTSNKQNMATVYYLGGLKNNLSNLWNSLLNIQNLANACTNANANIENYDQPANGNIQAIDVVVDTSGDLSGFAVNDYIQLTQSSTGGQGAIYSVEAVDDNAKTISFTQIYSGLNYEVDTNPVTVQTNGSGDTTALTITVTQINNSTDVNIVAATDAGIYWANETVEKLRIVNGASTSTEYVNTLYDSDTSISNSGSLENAITYWSYGLQDCLMSLMLSMTDTEASIIDSNGDTVQMFGEDTNTPLSLSSASVAPYMFNAASSQTQVGIMMKNKALGDYGEFLQNNARAWNMLLANLTYGPTTMFNINNVQSFIDQISTLSSDINAFCNELDILYVQVRSGTYSTQSNATNLQSAYKQIVTEINNTADTLNQLRTDLIDT